MAQKYVLQVIDDLTGDTVDSEDLEVVQFGLDGIEYTIDLTLEHAEQLRAVLERFVHAGRKAGPGGRAPSTRAEIVKQQRTIREWANSNGYRVNARGRIPASAVEAYTAKH